MKKITLLFSMLFMLNMVQELKAQDYQSAIGLRLGIPISASYKFFISEPAALELIVGYRNFGLGYSWFNVGGMYQHHFPISDVEGLKWYVGGGAALQFYNYRSIFGPAGDGFGISLNGVLGLDYTFADAPFNLSVDWMPTIFISGITGFGGGYGALSARYILN